ncbi:hypothetical protein H072_8994 [Dactylellina haptotyla CBS 200.50]|uniref:Cyanovirin-N domain-containing protein n=1 Tax=Dactylellina haptotyla (strain CBS 200.50) TaxID=1284197 RepID=S8A2Z1_DACHA|nr:hypothetical protein H072_8994 [Dactylellina haptotyla CBS 200.50]
MRFSSIVAIGSSVLPALTVASVVGSNPEHMAGVEMPDFSNPYRRPSFDEHRFPPPPVVLSEEKLLKKRQSGSANFIVHMCRDATQASCDSVWVSSAQYCYDNEHWFGWSGDPGTFISAKLEGTMCCAFFTDKTCNKAGGHVGWGAKICGDDSGDALIVNKAGTIFSWMCNIPYGSANVAMDSSPADVSAVPSGAGAAPVATQYAP